MDAYWHRNKLLIFDDAEVLWRRPGGRVLLRALCEHKPNKTLQWTSTAKELSKAGVPQKFNTSSKVAIIANQLSFGGEAEREAVLDRGHLVYFDPTPVEVHSRVAEWFWDQEIYDFVGERLHLLNETSVRIYIKAWERKEARGDWIKLVEEGFCHDKAKLLVQALEVDPECKTVDQRVAKFIEQTSLSRATYFNVKRQLKDNDQLVKFDRISVPRRQLRGTPPSKWSADEVEVRNEPESTIPNWSVSPEYDPADWWKQPQLEDVPEPGHRDNILDGNDPCSWLRREMRKAIEREDYERAAEYRDMINRIDEDQDKRPDR